MANAVSYIQFVFLFLFGVDPSKVTVCEGIKNGNISYNQKKNRVIKRTAKVTAKHGSGK